MDDAEKMLSKDLLFRGDETLPAIDLYSWHDNQNNHQAGHYFAKDTERHKEAQKRMMDALQQSPRWRSMMEHSVRATPLLLQTEACPHVLVSFSFYS